MNDRNDMSGGRWCEEVKMSIEEIKVNKQGVGTRNKNKKKIPFLYFKKKLHSLVI